MNIALIGYGKMGKTIESISISRGHTIVAIIDPSQGSGLEELKKTRADVVIEFTQPESALKNILFCIQEGIPVISGTTGWLDHWNRVEETVKEYDGTFFYASNFSIGVNLFFKLNNFLAKLMAGQNQYKVSMEEIHHTEKKDSPSGTALTLTKPILQHHPELKGWKETEMDEDHYLAIHSKREGKVPGTHIIHYKGPQDQITIAHEAYSREGFALGAVLVAEWISGKKGMLSMENFLSL
jgi:4-hydroxy-tetrahydrodipicolinate reductase